MCSTGVKLNFSSCLVRPRRKSRDQDATTLQLSLFIFLKNLMKRNIKNRLLTVTNSSSFRLATRKILTIRTSQRRDHWSLSRIFSCTSSKDSLILFISCSKAWSLRDRIFTSLVTVFLASIFDLLSDFLRKCQLYCTLQYFDIGTWKATQIIRLMRHTDFSLRLRLELLIRNTNGNVRICQKSLLTQEWNFAADAGEKARTGWAIHYL